MELIVLNKAPKLCDPCLNYYREIRYKAVGSGISGRILNSDNSRPEVTSDVISGLAVYWVGIDAWLKYGYSRLNNGRIIHSFPAAPVLLTFVQYLIAEAARQVTSSKCIKLTVLNTHILISGSPL